MPDRMEQATRSQDGANKERLEIGAVEKFAWLKES